jgi:tetratricopeptide (TPR) repeat protein
MLTEAAEWYARAGKQAKDTYALEAAIEYYQKALEFLPSNGEAAATRRIEVYEGMGRTLQLQARYVESEKAYTAMEAAATEAGDAMAQARAWLGLWLVKRSLGDYQASLEVTERAEELARAAGAPGRTLLAEALRRKGWTHTLLGDAEASALGEQALAISRELNDRNMIAQSLNLLGAIAYDLHGDSGQAVRHLEEAVVLFRDLGDRLGVVRSLNNLGYVTLGRGDYGAAVDLFQEALAIAREIGLRQEEMLYLSNLGGAWVGLGEYSAAETDLREAIHLAETSGYLDHLSETYRFLAEALLGQEKVEAALSAARKALALGQEHDQPFHIGGAWRALGVVAAQLPEPIAIEDRAYDAAACYAESLRIFTEKGIEQEQARTLRMWAEYEMARGDRERGEAMWEEASETLASLGVEA